MNTRKKNIYRVLEPSPWTVPTNLRCPAKTKNTLLLIPQQHTTYWHSGPSQLLQSLQDPPDMSDIDMCSTVFYLQWLHHTAMVMCLISSRISRLHCLWHSERMNMAAQNKRSQQRHAMPCFCAWSWASMPASINTQLHHHNSLPKYFWPLRSQQQLRLHPANQCS